MIDTHTHLCMEEYAVDGGGEAAVRRAFAAGVGQMILANVDLASLAPNKALAAQFPGKVFTATGLHPTEIGDDWRDVVAQLMAELDGNHPHVAVGEIGVDYHWDTSRRAEQIEVFDIQVDCAVKANLPIIIHSRDGLEDTLSVLRNHPGVRGVFHSFSGSEADVEAIRQVGDFYFGINGIVTFKNSRLREVLPTIGLDRLLLETDAPFLAPVPMRGKRNESAFLPYIAAHIAQYMGINVEDIDRVTTANAHKLFGFN